MWYCYVLKLSIWHDFITSPVRFSEWSKAPACDERDIAVPIPLEIYIFVDFFVRRNRLLSLSIKVHFNFGRTNVITFFSPDKMFWWRTYITFKRRIYLWYWTLWTGIFFNSRHCRRSFKPWVDRALLHYNRQLFGLSMGNPRSQSV